MKTKPTKDCPLDLEYYKQAVRNLEHDMEMLEWLRADEDLPFLKEIRDHLQIYMENKDITRYELAMKMISDWIDELQEIWDEK